MVARTRRLLPIALAVVAYALPAAPATAAKSPGPVVIQDGPARFEVLSPTLIRLEYADDGQFEDAPTLTAATRGGPGARVRTRVANKSG